MDIDSFCSDRSFKIWEYTVSMGLLLLRSVKGPTHDTQVDVLFRVTSHVCLAMDLDRLVVSEASTDEAREFVDRHGSVAVGSKLFNVNGSGRVVARSIRTAETSDDYFAPSPLMIDFSL